MKSMDDLIAKAKTQSTKTLVVAMADDPHVLEAVEMARKEGIVKAILVGDKIGIKETLNDLNIDPSQYTIEHETDPDRACYKAVRHVSKHPGHFLMKGHVDTSVILKAALTKEDGLRTGKRLSHVSVIEIPTYHKLLLMSDGAMNIKPTVDEKQEIIENAITIAQAVGIKKPGVGCIAAVEKVNPKMQATLDAQELIDRNRRGAIKNAIVDGPFALDNAINKDAAEHKGITSPIAGDVDILLLPQIESGNVFYKSMMFLANAKSASVIAGAKKPIVLTSRADSNLSKFYSIALSALVADTK